MTSKQDPDNLLWLAGTGALTAALAYTYYQLHKTRHQLDKLQNPQAQNVNPDAVLAAIECGGTTCRAVITMAGAPTVFLDELEIPTEGPQETIDKLVEWLRGKSPFDAIGIASFGPVDLNMDSETYGFITSTPKRKWRQFNLLQPFREFHVPIGFDTDVNAPALAELEHGDHEDVTGCAFITVGTGVGVGIAIDGQPIHGLTHPEGGHIMPLRYKGDDYVGWDEVQHDAVESLISSRAIAERTGVKESELASLPDSHEVWDVVAYYLAQLCLAITYIVSPHVIVVSGGIIKRECLLPLTRKHFVKLNNNYVRAPKVTSDIDTYIVRSKFANDIGVIGATELARRQLLG